jgi:hypothetical protein
MNEPLQLADASSADRLLKEAHQGRLFGLIDPFFDLSSMGPSRGLETKDTDPLFFDMIAWDLVTYEPPTLIKLDPASTRFLLDTLSTERWGVFVISEMSLEALARHFQKFIIAKGPDGNPYFLRFHDASVLEVLLKTWLPEERRVFEGPVIGFGLPDLHEMNIRFVWRTEGAPTSSAAIPAPEDCLLQLRRDQLQQCGEAIERDLVWIIYWHLRNYHTKAVQVLDTATLESRIRVAIERARHYQLSTIADLAGFAALMFELAPNFDEHPSFHRVLADQELAPEVRMKRMAQVISEREWAQALAMYDRNFWRRKAG